MQHGFGWAAILLFLFYASCTPKKIQSGSESIKQSEPIYLPNAFSNEILDSNFLKLQLNSHSILEPHREDILEFYRRRNFHSAWFHNGKTGTAADDLLMRVHAYSEVFRDSSLLAGPLFAAIERLPADSMLLQNQPALKSDIEIGLTALFFLYARKAYFGKSEKSRDLEWYIPARKKNYLQLLDTLLHPHADYSAYEPVNEMYKRLQSALRELRSIEKSGGYPEVWPLPKSIAPGDSQFAVISWKKYLSLADRYPATDLSPWFTDTLRNCILQFQKRMGLPPTGRPDDNTLAEMQLPVEFRIRQVMINLERLRWLPEINAPDYLLINIPDFKLYVFEGGKPNWSMKVIVGKTATSTSIFSGMMNQIVFSPYWNVPSSIAVNELLPQIKKNPGYLRRKNMEVLAGGKVIDPQKIAWKKYSGTLPFQIREKPGPTNSLGRVKFLFPNQYHIYLHDTPAKSLFDQDRRAFSHGCIRLAEPQKLAMYLLRNDTSVTPEKIKNWMEGETEIKINLHPPVPVVIGYFTTWVNQEGQLHFRNDLYGLDEKLWNEIFGNQPE